MIHPLRRRHCVLVLLCLVLLLASCGEKRWEYAVIAPPDEKFQAELARMGAQGWELVSARRTVTSGVPAYELIFKRPLRGDGSSTAQRATYHSDDVPTAAPRSLERTVIAASDGTYHEVDCRFAPAEGRRLTAAEAGRTRLAPNRDCHPENW
jgi:Domain of unknown function (DUF4177)